MNKRDILNRLRGDIVALELLIQSVHASDMKIELEAKLGYANCLLEWIQQEGKV
jgi:hypothetical protein